MRERGAGGEAQEHGFPAYLPALLPSPQPPCPARVPWPGAVLLARVGDEKQTPSLFLG